MYVGYENDSRKILAHQGNDLNWEREFTGLPLDDRLLACLIVSLCKSLVSAIHRLSDGISNGIRPLSTPNDEYYLDVRLCNRPIAVKRQDFTRIVLDPLRSYATVKQRRRGISTRIGVA